MADILNPPKVVLRTLRFLNRECFRLNDISLLRRVKESTIALSIVMIKYVEVRSLSMGLGFAVQFVDKQNIQLAACEWSLQMGKWDSLHWAWFIALCLAPLSKYSKNQYEFQL